MEAKKLDQLFKKKVQKAKIEPSNQSWDRLETMLDQKEQNSPRLIWRIAASVVLILASAVAFQLFSSEDFNNQLADRMDVELQIQSLKPTSALASEFDLAMTRVEIIETDIVLDEPVLQHTQNDVMLAEATVMTSDSANDEIFIEAFSDQEFYEILASIVIEEEPAQVTQPEPKQIRITYKRTPIQTDPKELVATADQDSTKQGPLKKLWQKSKEIDAGNLWADLRDAKDNLFARSDKKKNVKNSK